MEFRGRSYWDLHRRLTEEGKLDAIPRQAKVVESVLGLSQNYVRTACVPRR
jgi:hypothetical protein